MSFLAKYDGTCGECGEVIERGDRLAWYDDKAVHADCLPKARGQAKRPTCPKCWQEIAANGECGCDPS